MPKLTAVETLHAHILTRRHQIMLVWKSLTDFTRGPEQGSLWVAFCPCLLNVFSGMCQPLNHSQDSVGHTFECLCLSSSHFISCIVTIRTTQLAVPLLDSYSTEKIKIKPKAPHHCPIFHERCRIASLRPHPPQWQQIPSCSSPIQKCVSIVDIL